MTRTRLVALGAAVSVGLLVPSAAPAESIQSLCPDAAYDAYGPVARDLLTAEATWPAGTLRVDRCTEREAYGSEVVQTWWRAAVMVDGRQLVCDGRLADDAFTVDPLLRSAELAVPEAACPVRATWQGTVDAGKPPKCSTGSAADKWWGICHAWAPATLIWPEPVHADGTLGRAFGASYR